MVEAALAIDPQAAVHGGGSLIVNPNASLLADVEMSVSVLNFGSVHPGQSAGQLAIAGDYEQFPGGKLMIELGGRSAGDQYDRLIVAGGGLTLGGILVVELVDLGSGPLAPEVGDQFDILDFNPSELTGVFDILDLQSPGMGQRWDTSALYRTGVLSVVERLAADFNGDGQVDEEDLANWQNGFGSSGNAGPEQGDADGDQDVDGADLLAWQLFFGSAESAPNQSVPEPAASWLALAAILVLLSIRKGQMLLWI